VLSSEKDAINQYVPDRLSAIHAIENDSTKYEKDKTKIESAYRESDANYQELIQILNDNNNTLNEYMVNQQNMPERPNIGEEYGIFESMSGWLLKTESMSLALIVGLFGFGLLGAIGSSFIRQKITTDKPDQIEDYVPNLPIVLISGLSSAIVVFLAVKGAIVVFATKDANLNPYILFFTCLVAAVYSEDIWAWARKKLLTTFDKKDGDGGAGGQNKAPEDKRTGGNGNSSAEGNTAKEEAKPNTRVGEKAAGEADPANTSLYTAEKKPVGEDNEPLANDNTPPTQMENEQEGDEKGKPEDD